MSNLKEIKNANQLDKLLSDNIGILDGVRFAVPPSKINKLNIIINKISFSVGTIILEIEQNILT